MAEYIDRDALISLLDVGHLRHPSELCYSEIDVANILLHFKTEDVAPVVHGRWIQSKELPNCARCTACNKLTRANGVDRTGNAHVHKAVYIYCPHCGAKMDLEG